MKNLLLIALLISSLTGYAQTSTITVMTYNILNFPNPSNNLVLGNDAARAIDFREIVEAAEADVILIQEMKEANGADLLVNELNANGVLGKTYNAANYVGYNNNGSLLGNMLIYNDDLFDFVAQEELPQATLNGFTAPRATSRYELSISTNCGGIPIEFYSSHFKAGTDGANGNQPADKDLRDAEADILMNFINTLSATDNIIVAGDFNLYSSSATGTYGEPAYINFTNASNTHQLSDKQNGWTRNISADAYKYTQSTRGTSETNTYGNGGIPGGLDDRFDHIFINPAIDGNLNGIAYVAGSYQTYGSPGILNSEATAGTFPLENEIKTMSDHYPVIMQLEVCGEVISACPAPTNGIASSITNTSAELSWNASQNLFDIEWGIAGFTVGSGTTISDVANPYTLTGLTSGTNYEYYVCGQCIDTVVVNSENLIITGVFDGTLTGGTPKGVELYALNDIPDLSQYGLSSANNGAGPTGAPEFTFPATSLSAGTYIYVSSETVEFNNFFGFTPDYTNGAMLVNGDDAVELFYNGVVIDVFGDVNTDGSNTPWEYTNGWAYRDNGQGTNGGTFTVSDWTYSGTNNLYGGTNNATATVPFPLASYVPPIGGIETTLSDCAGPFAFTTTSTSCPPVLNVNGTISSGLYQAGNTVNSNGIIPIGSTVQFKAGQIICIENGFSMGPAVDFSAEIEGCN